MMRDVDDQLLMTHPLPSQGIRRTTRNGQTYTRVWCDELGMYAWHLEEDDKTRWPSYMIMLSLVTVTATLLATLGVAMLKLTGVL